MLATIAPRREMKGEEDEESRGDKHRGNISPLGCLTPFFASGCSRDISKQHLGGVGNDRDVKLAPLRPLNKKKGGA